MRNKKASHLSEALKLYQRYYKYRNDYNRKHVANVRAYPFGEFQTVSGIDFRHEIVPTPSEFLRTEQNVEQTSDGKQQIWNRKVFKVH